ncbi:MAG: GAF domain-containing protein [Pyrinomonadaceae bacterium]|nr:GAF domain-containing protein [Pyrinomonadaceae bacterium]
MTPFPYFKSLLTSVVVASAAALFSSALWLLGLLESLQNAFIVLPKSTDVLLVRPSFWLGTLMIGGVSLAVSSAVARFGGRGAVQYLGGGFLGMAALSLAASRFFFVDILFVPMALAALMTAVTMQINRLRNEDIGLTYKLMKSSSRMESLAADDAEHRLLSGLRLLDTVLSPVEAVVFRRDSVGHLVSSARLRSPNSNSPETGRNSAWRDGVGLCERSMAAGEILVEKVESGDLEQISSNIALPLRHEERTVGALLLRVTREFDADDRALLTAVGGQMARNLQREEVHTSTSKLNPFAFFSARAARQKLQSLYVLNGAMVEQSVGVNALSELADGVALAYLDGRIAHVNKPLLALAGLAEDKASSISFLELLDHFRTGVFDEPAIAVRRVLQTGETYERELPLGDRNETYSLRISLVKQTKEAGAAQPLCLALVVKDLTQLKEYEQLKSDMISLMSHELRTPLTSINGFAELLASDDELPEQTREFVTIIANESQRMSRMINTFLTVTKLQRKDRQEVLKIPLRLDEVVKETIAGMQPVAKKRRIRLVEQPTQRLPPVAADKSMITQAIKNLVGNAIKYSPERTTVTVSTTLEAEAVRLCVEDRGYGIPAELKDRVWEKFYRVVREGEDKDEESTGLGLSFVREVVEQHGGCVELETEVGRGSKFSFTLPRL